LTSGCAEQSFFNRATFVALDRKSEDSLQQGRHHTHGVKTIISTSERGSWVWEEDPPSALSIASKIPFVPSSAVKLNDDDCQLKRDERLIKKCQAEYGAKAKRDRLKKGYKPKLRPECASSRNVSARRARDYGDGRR
jgi:hypothetical protein